MNVHSDEQSGDPTENPNQNPTHQDLMVVDTNNTGDNCSSSSDLDGDDLPLSELKQKEEDNMPLFDLKQQLLQEKPFFKTKSYKLYKYKCKQVFKCIKCRHTKGSKKHINIDFKNTHGYLVCDNSDKQCNTISAMCKHAYAHTQTTLINNVILSQQCASMHMHIHRKGVFEPVQRLW